MQKKNVLVFFTDQQRWDSTGVHGNPLGLTPNFDRIAKSGTHCFNTYTCQPVCGPARASLQTGLYATKAGVPTNSRTMHEDCRTLGEYFTDAGYHTGYIGKWHLGSGNEAVAPAQRKGYQYWLGSNTLEFTSDSYFTVMYDSLGLEKDTIVVFTTDHGCHFKTRNNEYKRSCHESSARIPLSFTGGEFTGGGEIRELVSLVDVPPTLLDAAGIPVPDVMQGRNIMPLGRREKTDWPDDVFMQIGESIDGRAIRCGRWKYSVESIDTTPGHDHMPTLYQDDFLYDLYADPYELDNRIGMTTLAAVTADLRERLKKRVKAVEGVDIEIQPAEQKQSGQPVFNATTPGTGPFVKKPRQFET